MYCAVSGGPFGLETLVKKSGPGLAILLVLLTPLVWCVPDALTTAELASAIPAEGGYVIWVERALGPFWAWINGWWTWLYALVDAAIYPVMFSDYLLTMMRHQLGWHIPHSAGLSWMIAVVMMLSLSWINIRGAKTAGRTSSIFAIALVIPFIFMGFIGLIRIAGGTETPHLQFLPPHMNLAKSLSAGLGIVLWNYLGWDTLSTIGEEVENPGKAFPFSIFWGVPIVTAVYLIAIVIGLWFFPHGNLWKSGIWPSVGIAVGGPILGWLIAVAALISPGAQFVSSLLGASRIPFVLAEHGFFPKSLVDLHPKYRTPWKAILLCSVIFAILALKSFQSLITLNVALYGAALTLECLSLAILRRKEPNLLRPFRIPGPLFIVDAIVVIPVLVIGLLIVLSTLSDGWGAQIPTGIAILSGPILFYIIRFRKKGS